MFCGAAGTETSLHFDSTDNIVSIIRGSKRLVLFSPTEQEKLFDKDIKLKREKGTYGVGGVVPITNGSKYQESEELIVQHPLFQGIENGYCDTIREGEILFIPRRWSHYLHNLEFTISISCWARKLKNKQ